MSVSHAKTNLLSERVCASVVVWLRSNQVVSSSVLMCSNISLEPTRELFMNFVDENRMESVVFVCLSLSIRCFTSDGLCRSRGERIASVSDKTFGRSFAGLFLDSKFKYMLMKAMYRPRTGVNKID